MAMAGPVFLFDLDGTVTAEELLPRIAAHAGIEPEMRALTEATVAGRAPFEESLRHRVGLLGRLPIAVVRDVCASARLNDDIVGFIRERPERCAIVTGNLDVWIRPLAERIGARLFCSTAAVQGDRVVGIARILRKVTVLDQVDGAPVVAIGDGHNDAELLERAAVGVAFGGVHAPASSLLDVCTHAVYDSAHLCRFLRQLS